MAVDRAVVDCSSAPYLLLAASSLRKWLLFSCRRGPRLFSDALAARGSRPARRARRGGARQIAWRLVARAAVGAGEGEHGCARGGYFPVSAAGRGRTSCSMHSRSPEDLRSARVTTVLVSDPSLQP